jgi:hypothetical protein
VLTVLKLLTVLPVLTVLGLAEVDGNRTRQAEMLGLTGVEDRGDHQVPGHLQARPYPPVTVTTRGAGRHTPAVRG